MSCSSLLLQIVIVDSLCDLFFKFVFCWFFSVYFSCQNLQQNYNPLRILNTNIFAFANSFVGPSTIEPKFISLGFLTIENLNLLLPLKLIVWFWTLLMQKGTMNCKKKRKKAYELNKHFQVLQLEHQV